MSHATGTGKYELLLERCRSLEAVPTAVAHPCEETALAGAIEGGQRGLIIPILVGPAAKLHEVAKKSGIDLEQQGHSRRSCSGAEHHGQQQRHVCMVRNAARRRLQPVLGRHVRSPDLQQGADGRRAREGAPVFN